MVKLYEPFFATMLSLSSNPTTGMAHSPLRDLSGTAATPIVILVGCSLPLPQPTVPVAQPYQPPLALQTFHGKLLADHWWDALVGVGLNLQTHVFLVTNAAEYKPFEMWALGKGIPLTHLINTGASLDDKRVDLRSLLHTITVAHRAVRPREASATEDTFHDYLVLAMDSAPPHSGATFNAVLSTLLRSNDSAILLEPPHADATAPAPQVGPGPVIRAYFEPDTTTGLSFVKDLKISVVASSHIAPEVAGYAGMQTSFSPLVYLIKGPDARALTYSPPTYETIAADVAGLEGIDPDVPLVIPIEAGIAWLARHRTLVGYPLLDKFQIGAADGSVHGIEECGPLLSPLAASRRASFHGQSALFSHGPVSARAFARVGLVGNPSDGFGGKTVAVTIENFAAEVSLIPAKDATITLTPHPICDPVEFANLRQLSTISGREGYSGGIRLLQATLHRFFLHCRSKDVSLGDRGFMVKYHTTIPRQVGLAGSSAIVTAFMRALLKFYGYETEEKAASIGLSRDLLASFVLAIETEELGITAGLQDRVVQSFEGLVHMDFNSDLIKSRGFGSYTKLDVSALPPFFLAFAADPSDSGRIHAPIKQRWLAGDKEVIDAMSAFATFADGGLSLITTQPYSAACSVRARESVAAEWATLFTSNFDSRRKLFGDAALGKDNIRMIEIAREMGASGKLPGSGGAIVGVVDVAGMVAAGRLHVAPLDASGGGGGTLEAVSGSRVTAAVDALREAYLKEGYVFTRITPHSTAL